MQHKEHQPRNQFSFLFFLLLSVWVLISSSCGILLLPVAFAAATDVSSSVSSSNSMMASSVAARVNMLRRIPLLVPRSSKQQRAITTKGGISRYNNDMHRHSVKMSSSSVLSGSVPSLPDTSCSFSYGTRRWLSTRGGGGGDNIEHTSNINKNTSTYKRRAYIAIGSNMGDRFHNIMSALSQLSSSSSIHPPTTKTTSYLHETKPMYVTDQPAFLNGVFEIETTLEPMKLLDELKRVERSIGRKEGEGVIRYGPRPIDLDILFYCDSTTASESGSDATDGHFSSSMPSIAMDSERLIIPHPRMHEREFVLVPLSEINPDAIHPLHNNKTVAQMLKELKDDVEMEAVRVIPLPNDRMLYLNRTLIMGILNVTPDSFSDGGRLKGSVEIATQEALQMIKDGADIIDIGGESTRPGAKEITPEEELSRTISVIQQIRKVSNIPISIDTRRAIVARAAINAGADIVNDVSGGAFDPDMLSTVASLSVPFILMHMRGTPETMQTMTKYDNQGVVHDVARELMTQSALAEEAGIPKWLQILDPGIGFAKDFDGNLSLMKHINDKFRELTNDSPLLLGPSRKGFIGKITGEENPEERDFGTVGACVAMGMGNNDGGIRCHILRVHNVKGMKQAAMVMDSINLAD